MEEWLKSLRQDLGSAISDTLTESKKIEGAINEIRRAGYDVFLVLEATISFNKREDAQDQPGEEPRTEPREVVGTDKVRFTTQDQRFLKGLHIEVPDEA